MIETLEDVKTFEQWMKVRDRLWNDNIFKATKVRVGNPADTKDDVMKVVLVEPSDPEME